MNKFTPLIMFIFTEVSLLLSYFLTSSHLPETVATHFGSNGEPDGFMSHNGYITFMVIFTIVCPLFILGAVRIGFLFNKKPINVPNKHYWMAPEQKENTIRFIKDHLTNMATIMCLFLGFMHWLIIESNKPTPARLNNSYLLWGIGILLVIILIWTVLLFTRFLRVPKTSS